MATKSSMIIFYLRLSRNTHEFLRAASWTNIAGIILTFFNVFQCIPVSQVFDPSGKCIPLIELYLASVPVNVITDIAVLVLPIPVLTGMQLPRKQKTILVATFGLGLYVIATDVVRIYYLQQSSSGYWGSPDISTSPLLGNEIDFAWYASLSFLWSAIEVNVGLVCACIPTLKPLIGKVWPTLIDNKRWSSCFWASTQKSGSSTTAVSSPVPVLTNGFTPNAPSPIRPPRPAVTTNTETHVSSPGQFSFGNLSSFATETIRSLPPTNGENQNGEMEMLEFVTSPGMDPESIPRVSVATSRTQADVYFGFLSIKRPKSMLRTSRRDSIKYGMLISVVFFLCGFSHGLWNNLNNQISKVSANSMARTLGLYSVYYSAYIFGPQTVGRFVLVKGGFKATLITGLCIYGTGVFMFWPSAVLLSFPGFMISNFFVGFGLSIVEMATETFITLCGPPFYGEVRLLVAQGVEGIGKVVGMLLAAKGLFQNVTDGPALLHIQWIYLGVSLFSVVLALAYYYLPLPEATDSELEQALQPGLPQLNHTIIAPTEQRFHFNNCTVASATLFLGFVAQFLSWGVYLGNGVWFGATIGQTPPNSRVVGSFDYLLVADASFALGRFVFAAVCVFAPPRIILLLCFLVSIVFTSLVFAITNLSRNAVAALIIVLFFFEGPIMPLIFSISLRGMGRRTKTAAGVLTSAQAGASVVVWLMYAISTGERRAIRYTYCLLIGLLAVASLYPIYLSASSKVRQQIDRGEKHQEINIFENREWPGRHGTSETRERPSWNAGDVGMVSVTR
jgi:fucose permease